MKTNSFFGPFAGREIYESTDGTLVSNSYWYRSMLSGSHVNFYNVDWRSDIGSPANYQQNPSNAFEAASRQTTGANLAGRLALDLFPM